MSFAHVFEALKAHYRARGLRYRDVAREVGVSEATIKRIFSECDCTLSRLESLCAVAQVDLHQVARGVPRERKLLTRLTRQQEQDLVDNIRLFIVAVCAMGNLRFDEMVRIYRVPEAECVRLLARLDRIGFLELLPNNRYRTLVARTFAWIPDGPIMRFTRAQASDYFDHPFVAPGETLRLVNVRISDASRQSLLARLDEVAQAYADQHAADAWMPLEQRRPLSLCLAVRTWEPKVFKTLRRSDAAIARKSGAARTTDLGAEGDADHD